MTDFEETTDWTAPSDRFVVVVRHNLVAAIRRATEAGDIRVPQTKLEIGTQLAQNFQRAGFIDGDYYFDDAKRAKVFASLCLEFTQALLARRLEAVRKLPLGTEYDAA